MELSSLNIFEQANFERLISLLIIIVVMAMFLERALSVLFEWGPQVDVFIKFKIRAPIALVVAWAAADYMNLDVVAILMQKSAPDGWITLGKIIAAGVIAGVTNRGRPWTGSSRGEWVDVSAPAVEIWRATTIGSWPHPQFVYGNDGDGASYATVHVSGAAALWIAHHDVALHQYQARPWQIVEAFRAVLKSSASKHASLPHDWQPKQFGASILDIV